MRIVNGIVVLKVALEGRRSIWRRIAIRSEQTLDDLALAINRAFDRDNDHLYAFYIGPKSGKLTHRQLLAVARRYAHPHAVDAFLAREKVERSAADTTLASLRLAEGQTFYYLFDFGDEWWHFITVESVSTEPDPQQTYPAVIAFRGASPKQYPEDEE